MENIYTITERLLNSVFERYYHGMPEFGEGEEPEIYGVYTVRNKGANYAADIHTEKQYWIEISVFSPQVDVELYNRIENEFTANNFIYQGGYDAGSADLYPYKLQYVMDFYTYI